MNQLYLTRRNLLTLLNKLDRVKDGDESACTIIKVDTIHPKYKQTIGATRITAIEDEDYYVDRQPGPVHYLDEPQKYSKRK